MIKLEVTVPKMRPVVRNERAVITAMTARLAQRIKARTASGQGSDGALPRGKGDNPPLRRSGTMLASIAHAVRERNGKVDGIVRAFGKRPQGESAAISKRRASARQRTAQLRAAAVVGGFLRTAAEPSSGRGRVRLSRVRVRTVTDNASLAAILSVPPKDKRGRAGGRGVYRVFAATEAEQSELGEMARSTMVVELVEVG